MNLLRSLFVALFAGLVLAGCAAEETKPPTAGEVKEFAAACDKANEGKRIAVVGYLKYPEEIKDARTGFVLQLFPSNDRSGKPIGVSVKTGSQPNQAALPSKEYTDKGMKVTLASGETVDAFGKPFKVSGDVYYPVVGQTFECALSNPLIEAGS